mmetsp:Transcript_142919/g.249339  ORF Transcript_142919/g.249339 Transcript_142919/m.249339 type:complete len:174 (-) Transcript_142919:176-697(-)
MESIDKPLALVHDAHTFDELIVVDAWAAETDPGSSNVLDIHEISEEDEDVPDMPKVRGILYDQGMEVGDEYQELRAAGLRYAIILGGLIMFVQSIDVALASIFREEHYKLYVKFMEHKAKLTAAKLGMCSLNCAMEVTWQPCNASMSLSSLRIQATWAQQRLTCAFHLNSCLL